MDWANDFVESTVGAMGGNEFRVSVVFLWFCFFGGRGAASFSPSFNSIRGLSEKFCCPGRRGHVGFVFGVPNHRRGFAFSASSSLGRTTNGRFETAAAVIGFCRFFSWPPHREQNEKMNHVYEKNDFDGA